MWVLSRRWVTKKHTSRESVTQGGYGFPEAFELKVSPSSLDRIFYGWIFWKAYGWNCVQKTFFFEKKLSDFFLSRPKSGRFFENRKIFTYFALATFVSSKHMLKTLLIESIGPQLSKKSKIYAVRGTFFFADLKMLYFQKYQSDFEKIWFFGKLTTSTFD